MGDVQIARRVLPILLVVMGLAHCCPAALGADFPAVPSIATDRQSTNADEVATMVGELSEDIEVDGLAFSPTGLTLAATSTVSAEVHLWRWKERQLARTFTKERGSAGLYFEPLLFSPDGRFLLACHSRATKYVVVRIWDVATGNIAHDIDEPDGGSCNAIAFSPDGRILIRIRNMYAKQPGNSIIVYDANTWQPLWGLRTIPFYLNTVAISPDGRFTAVGGKTLGPGVRRQSLVQIVDMRQREVVRTIDAFSGDTTPSALAWSPDGSQIAAGVWSNTNDGGEVVRVFDARSGQKLAGEAGAPERTHVEALRYSPDGRYLAESMISGSVRVWDGQHQRLLQEIRGPSRWFAVAKTLISSLAFTRDSRFLAVGEYKRITIWKMK